MAEETKDPVHTFPKVMLTGLGFTAIVYVLVSIAAVAVVPVGTLSESQTPLLEVVRAGAPNLPVDVIYPFLSMFAVANTALINMLMASRLLYGLAKQDVLPRSLAHVSSGRRAPWVGIIFSTVLAIGLIWYVASQSDSPVVTNLSTTTALLLLAVFTVVNVACLALRRDGVDGFFKSPGPTPLVAALTSFLLIVIPWGERDPIVYRIAGGLIGIGIVLWALTWLTNRGVRAKKTGFRDIDHLEK
jgi:amino acid transporter